MFLLPRCSLTDILPPPQHHRSRRYRHRSFLHSSPLHRLGLYVCSSLPIPEALLTPRRPQAATTLPTSPSSSSLRIFLVSSVSVSFGCASLLSLLPFSRCSLISPPQVTNITDEAIYSLHVRTSLERIHLSYCDNLTVGAVNEMLQQLPRLTHLSLTGVSSFRKRALQQFCRPPPRVSRRFPSLPSSFVLLQDWN